MAVTYKTYMRQYVQCSGKEGDLAREIMKDAEFPASKKFEVNFNYLYPLLPDIAMDVFKDTWIEYSKELFQEISWDKHNKLYK